MCKQEGKSFCSELTEDIAVWSKDAPLAKPEWILESIDFFINSFTLAMDGKIGDAQQLIIDSPDIDLRTWFDVHAQNTGTWRYKALGVHAPTMMLPLDPVKTITKLQALIFARDNFHCRYCDSKVIPKPVFVRAQGILGQDPSGTDFVPLGETNMSRSGYYLMFAGTLDHVIPHSLGGRTDASNLVTCCWSCNYGKMNYALEQLGLNNPMDRAPHSDSTWKGLQDFDLRSQFPRIYE